MYEVDYPISVLKKALTRKNLNLDKIRELRTAVKILEDYMEAKKKDAAV